MEFPPSYLQLPAGELDRRVEALDRLLESCTVCPWDCHVNRLRDETKVCVAGYLPIVSSYAPHFGEEPALSGTLLGEGARGTGNIFLGHCNLRCVYCQNWQISQDFRTQRPNNETSFERLAEMMLELQERGCHNIGFVSPTHFAPQMARGIFLAAKQGLKLPVVYNTNAYDAVDVLRLLNNVVDIYLPDLKYADSSAGYEYSKVKDYKEHSRRAILEMYRQTGHELVFGEDGLLKRGLVIRLLVLPNDLAGIRESLEWIKDTLSPRVAVSMMAQYYATNRAATDDRYTLLSRRITETEWIRALSALDVLGMEEGWMQEFDGAAHYYRPDFEDRATPFKDVRDFG